MAAAWLNTGALQSKLHDEATAASGSDWLQLAVNGRDATITGEAPSQEALDAAVKAVAGVRGIRRVAAEASVKPPEPPPQPVALTAPTVQSLTTNKVEPEIKGTWPEAAARSLTVTLGDRRFTLGSGNELKSDGAGNWTLKLPAPLADGSYDVGAEASDGTTTLKSETPGKIVIDTVAPAAPKFDAIAIPASPTTIAGAWEQADGAALKVILDGTTYELDQDKDKPLTSEGGHWTLKPAAPLGEGRHDLAVETTDAAGNVASANFPRAILVDSRPPPPPTIHPLISKKLDRLSGTWATGDAKTLNVKVGGHTYEQGVFNGFAVGKGTWSLALPGGLPDGTYDVEVSTADAAGNVSADDTRDEVVVDSVVPVVPTVTGIVNGKLTGTWAEGDAQTLKVTVDGHVYDREVFKRLTTSKGVWTLDIPGGLPDGTYDVTVETADRAGNVATDATKDEIVVDSKPPEAPTVDGFVGSKSPDQLTGTWAQEDAKSLRVTVDGHVYDRDIFRGLTSANRRWALTIPGGLADGVYDVVVETADSAGNRSQDTSRDEIRIDSQPPAPPTVDRFAGGKLIGPLTGTWAQGDATSLRVTVDGHAYQFGIFNGLTSTNGKWRLTVPGGLPDGTYDVLVETFDLVGNRSADTSKDEIAIDTRPPPAPTVAPFIGKAVADGLTGSWAEGDAVSLRVTVNGRSYERNVSPELTSVEGVWTLSVPGGLPDGSYEVEVETADAAGNVSKDTTRNEIIIDSVAPKAPTLAAGKKSTADRIAGTWDEAGSSSLAVGVDGHSYRYRVFNGLTSNAGEWALKLPSPLTPGNYDVAVETADAAGNVSKIIAPLTVAAPELPVAPTVAKSAGNNPTPEIIGTWKEHAGSTLTIVVGGKAYVLGQSSLTTDGAGNWKLLPDRLGDGIYDVVATVTTRSGLTARDTTVAEVEIDTIPPAAPTVVSGTAMPVSGTWASGDAKTLKVVFSGATYHLGTHPNLTANGSNWSLAAETPGEGIYDVAVETADALGNVSRDASTAEIIITAPPLPLPIMTAPTVEKYAGNNPAPQIKGTWDARVAQSLAVSLGGKRYELERDNALRSDGAGRWTLATEPLPDGYHDVVAETSDEIGNRIIDQTVAEVIVDTKGPEAPTVNPSNTMPATGTWAVNDAKSLKVKFNGGTYVLGIDELLNTENNGWTLSAKPPGPGIYDVEVETVDAFGNVSRDTSTAEIIIAAPPAPEPPQTEPPPAIMAAPTVAKYAGSDSTPDIGGTWDEALAQSLKVTIAGRTYTFRADPALVSDGAGRWSLAPERLPDGYFDVVVETADKLGNVARDASVAEVVIDSAGPEAPTVVAGTGTPVAGTWAVGDAQSLTIKFSGRVYVLGKDWELTASGASWKLAAESPGPGIYDVEVETADAFGNTSHDTSTAEIIIAASPAPDPPQPEPPAPDMATPTVDRYAGNNPTPRIGGTWDEAAAQSLSVTIAGKTYRHKSDSALTSDGAGHWSLTPDKLPDGYFDVVTETMDGAGNAARDSTVAEIVIDTQPPAAPTVNAGAAVPITGSWAPDDAKTLKVSFNGSSYILGMDQQLTIDGSSWSLAAASPQTGVYDVEVETADSFGNASHDATTAEIVIAAPAEPPSVAMAAPTVDKYAGNNPTPRITGTWDQAMAQKLTVAIAGKAYTLNTDAALGSDGTGHWSLTPDRLPDGYFDVVAEATAKSGIQLNDSTVAEVVIDTKGPEVPTVKAGNAMPATGTWEIRDAKTLKVNFNGRTYVLGIDQELSAQDGGWSLAVETPAPGIYDVEVETADTFGNASRDVSTAEINIAAPPQPGEPEPPPTVMAAPTVDPLTTTVTRPVVTGTWDEPTAKSLAVAVNSATYKLGESDALSSDGQGRWTLHMPAPLKDGAYDVAVTTTDASGTSASDSSTDELIVDAAGPAAPTVNLYSSETSPPAVTGTWAEGDASSLSVTLNGNTATLGADPALSSDEHGNWALALGGALEPGSYDVVVTTMDKRGRIATDQTKFEIRIKPRPEPEPTPEPVPEPQAVDCEAEFASILAMNSIHFETDKAAIRADSRDTVAKLAAVAKACPNVRFEVAGHTDDVGSNIYNQALSERRAVAVLKALAAQGVNAMRLTARGYGEVKPLADNSSSEGRAINRRIEITVESKGQS